MKMNDTDQSLVQTTFPYTHSLDAGVSLHTLTGSWHFLTHTHWILCLHAFSILNLPDIHQRLSLMLSLLIRSSSLEASCALLLQHSK